MTEEESVVTEEIEMPEELMITRKALEDAGYKYYPGEYKNGTRTFHFIHGTDHITILYTVLDPIAKKSVPGIGKIRKMESLGDFDVDKIVEVINVNKDIIRRVETDGEDSISVYLNLRATKDKLVEGIADMFGKFNARSVDLDYDKEVRVLKFWWDSSEREI